MKVSELVPSIDGMNLEFHRVLLGGIDFNLYNGRAELSWMTLESPQPLTLSENNHFLRYLKISPTTYDNLTPQLKREIVTYLLQKWQDSEVELVTQGGEVIDVHSTTQKYLTVRELAETVSKCFDPEDEIIKFSLDKGFKCYVTDASHQLEIRESDYTYGGLYFKVLPNESPVVTPFLLRELGRTGMTLDESRQTVSYRGRTTLDVLHEIKVNAQFLLRNVSNNLQGYRVLSELDMNDREQYVHRLCQEHEVSGSIESAGIERLSNLRAPQDSIYDVVNVLMDLQNENGVRETQVEKLQSLGGSVVRDAGSSPRCKTCQTRLI